MITWLNSLTPPPFLHAFQRALLSPSKALPHHSASALNIATVDATLASLAYLEQQQFLHNRRQQQQQQQHQRQLEYRRGSEQQKSVDRYSSLDSSDTFLSCNTHPFPSQGSLAGLEQLAAQGSMAPNGSMPAVNISGVNTMYVNPMERKKQQQQQQQQQQEQNRRVRIASRSLSSDNELDSWASCLDEAADGGGGGKRAQATEGGDAAPKHKRARLSQVGERGTEEVQSKPLLVENDQGQTNFLD